MVDTSQYRVGIVLTVEERVVSGQRPLRVCSVNVNSDDGNPITVVTRASNVRVGSRCVIAPVGSRVIDETSGEEITIGRTIVGGCPSEGVFCDSRMLGWGGGSDGIAARVPEIYVPGDAPPTTRPGMPPPPSSSTSTSGGGGGCGGTMTQAQAPGLFERKLTKEERKKLAEEKRSARRAAKEAKEKEEDGG
ncbi:hypothetical protein ACHAXA_003174 [Cyclostephanos tholiformis]|uniref:tRNA-binding domain-containing protein n=1 Tax=Cyclostephanos tholiformis TaxID=382380 RepID=A0ABD3SSW2_9STRA